MDRVYSIQILRFVAAAMVVALHVNQAAHWQLGLPAGNPTIRNIGSFGVDAFFVISGFIIARTASGHTPGSFFARRFARVVPFYWTMTALYLPFLVYSGSFEWLRGVATLTFYPGLSGPWLGVGWTLCFEMLFYGATALVLFDPRRLIPLALLAYALCWIARLRFGGPFEFFGNPIIVEFLAGAVIAQTGPQSKLVGAAAMMSAIGLLAIVAVFGIGEVNKVARIMDGSLSLPRLLVMGAPAALLVFGAAQIEARRGLFTYLGDASYAIYLTHRHALAILAMIGTTLPVGLFAGLAVALIALLSLLAFEFIEKPSVALARQSILNMTWRVRSTRSTVPFPPFIKTR